MDLKKLLEFAGVDTAKPKPKALLESLSKPSDPLEQIRQILTSSRQDMIYDYSARDEEDRYEHVFDCIQQVANDLGVNLNPDDSEEKHMQIVELTNQLYQHFFAT